METENTSVDVCKDMTEMDVSETETTLQGAGIQLLDQSSEETSKPAPPAKKPEQEIFKFRDARADSSRSDVIVRADDTQWLVIVEVHSEPEAETLNIPVQRLRFVCKHSEKHILIISVRDEAKKGRFHNILLQYLDEEEGEKAQQFLQTFITRYLRHITGESSAKSTGLKPHFLGNVLMDRRMDKKREGPNGNGEVESMETDSDEAVPPLQLQRLWCQIDEEALTLYDNPFSTIPRFWYFFHLNEAPNVVEHIAFQRKPPHAIKLYSHGETVEDYMLTTLQQLDSQDENAPYKVAMDLRFALKLVRPREEHVFSIEHDPQQFLKAFSREWCITPDLSRLPKANASNLENEDQTRQGPKIVRPKIRIPKTEGQGAELLKSMTGLLSNMSTTETNTSESVSKKVGSAQSSRVFAHTPFADALLSRYDPDYAAIPENIVFQWVVRESEVQQIKQLLEIPDSTLESGGLDPNSDDHLRKSVERIWEHFEKEEYGEVLSNLQGLKMVFIESDIPALKAIAELEDMALMKNIFFQAWKDGALRL